MAKKKPALTPAEQGLLASAAEGDLAAVKKHLAAGTNVDCRDAKERTPLLHACLRGRDKVCRALLAAGADPDARDAAGMAPLHVAAECWSSECVRLLLEAKATVDAQDGHTRTALSIAAFQSRGRGEVIELLLQHGANPLLENKNGVSAAALAKTIANFDVAQFFPPEVIAAVQVIDPDDDSDEDADQDSPGMVLVSHRVLRDREPVGWMFREEPDEPQDSGWRIFAGDESQEYADNAENLSFCSVSTILSVDPSIATVLASKMGTAWERKKGNKRFKEVRG